MKSNIRKIMIKKRLEMEFESVIELSKHICLNILSWDKYDEVESVMVYCDFKNEVKTLEFIKESFKRGKKVILPKTVMEPHQILPCEIKSVDELVPGVYGILEPPAECLYDRNKIGIILVPGVAFDAKGNRLGYGAGFYDAFLKGYSGIKAGICYSMQIVQNVYENENDIRMDYLITEMGITKTGDD